MPTLTYKIALGSRARVDHSDLVVHVQAVMCRLQGAPTYECTWISNGQNYEQWIIEERLEPE